MGANMLIITALATSIGCAPGQAELSDATVPTQTVTPTDTDTDVDADSDADTDTDTDADTDTDTDADTDVSTADTVGTADSGGLPPCGDGVCTWSLVVEETLPFAPGPPRGAIAAAVDEVGVVHVLVHDTPEDRLLYLRSDQPTPEVIRGDLAASTRTELSMAVDTDGRVHAATFGRDGYYLLAREPSGVWNEQPGAGEGGEVTTSADARGTDAWLATGSEVFSWTGAGFAAEPSPAEPVEALALDRLGVVHALVGTGGAEVVYTQLAAGAWGARAVLYKGTFERTRLAIDDADVGHAVVEVSTKAGRDLLYATTAGGTWSVDPLATGGDDQASSLAVDAATRPHVSYHDGTDGIFHGYHDGSGWVRSRVGDATEVQETVALVDPVTQQPVVVYFDVPTDTLRIYRGD